MRWSRIGIKALGWDDEADGGAAAGSRLDRQLAADQQGALAHAGDPEAALGFVEGEAAAVVADLKRDTVLFAAAQAHRDAAGTAVAGRVGERLLGDSVDDQLGVVVEVGEVAFHCELGLDLTTGELLDLAARSRR